MNTTKLLRFVLRGYPALAVITVVLIVWQHFGMNIAYQVFPNENVDVELYMDGINEGLSSASLLPDSDSLRIDCNIVAVQNTHAFCGLQINLSGALDVNRYDELNVGLEFASSLEDTTMVYLVNAEPDADTASHERANLRTVFVEQQSATFALPIRSFSVPSWWLLNNPTDELKGEPNLDNVVKLRITSGDNEMSRTQTIGIHHLSLSGKYLSNSELYLTLLTLWVSLSLAYAGVFYKKLYDESREMKARSEQLQRVNSFLDHEKDRYKKMAVTDPLTGALNRSGLGKIIEETIHDFVENNQPSAMILIDIDNFKVINDTHGHDVGDVILKDLVTLVSNNIRSSDELARWGGEEFAVICPRTECDEARLLAKKLRNAIELHRFEIGQVTCSFGVSGIDKNVETWFKAADRALYESKRAGKNRVTVAG
ncbi:GGDEF domain-containing protein [Aestuariibacter salexigens]|uniref:GGDEF domain-containing protein n=1 Tax=Aestuariibacter salexigens TaxID=226010 RepID=UPI00146FC1D7|nr:GGDEF domain-containing protein [Aestuariibacter salexigens]